MATSRGETRKLIANLNATTHRLKFVVVPQKLMKTRMRTFPNTTRRKMKRNTPGLVLQNVSLVGSCSTEKATPT